MWTQETENVANKVADKK